MTSSIETGTTLPLVGHLYDHTGAAATFKQSFKLLNTPDLSLTINGQGASAITLELDAPLSGGNAAPAKGDILTLTQDASPQKVIVARAHNSDPVNAPSIGYLRTAGFDVTVNLAATVADCRDYDVVVIDYRVWSAGQASTFIQALWNDGQQVLVMGNDTQTDIFYATAVVTAATMGVTEFTIAHPIGNGVGALENDGDGGFHIRGIVAGATKLGDFVGDTLGFSMIEYPHATSGGRIIHLQSGSVASGANWAILRANATRYLAASNVSRIVFKGIVEDFPDERGTTTAHQILVNPVGVQLGDNPFTTNYTAATDIGTIARAIVASCPNLTSDVTSIPLTGSTAIFDFSGTQGYTCLTALEELRKMAGVNFYYWPDMSGKVWFRAANVAGAADHSVMVAPQTEARKYSAPVSGQKNIVKAYGAVLAGATAPISATYDNSAGSPLGKRALVPPLTYAQLTDLTTLQIIANIVGSLVDRAMVTVELDVANYSKRIQPGDVLRYFEETKNELLESPSGSPVGAFSPNYVVLSAKQNGPRQSVVVSDIPFTLSDLQYYIDFMLSRSASGVVSSVTAGAPGTISPSMIGSTLPATPAAPSLSTAVERTAQIDNADVTASWLANAPGDFVSNYKVRWRKGAGPYTYIDAGGGSLTLTVHGLTPGTSYGLSVAAVNALGNIGAYSTEATIVAASDSTAPATPAGLTAIKTPRGALVSWNANTEADLKGYHLQVSVGGGGYVDVTVDSLVTAAAYVAPAGTALGTSLTFKIFAADWSGNFSAYSAASTAVNTDGIVFDELLAGNVKVFGTLTTGGLQTAASGARLALDSTSLRLYDGSATNYGAPSGAGVTTELKNDGSAFFQGTVSASKVFASTVATSALVGTTGNPGYQLAGQFLDFFTIGTSPEGGRYWYAPDSVTPFSLAGQLSAGTIAFPAAGVDSVTESISGALTSQINGTAMAIASFKKATTIALVKAGPFTTVVGLVTSTSITPAYGQATTAGNLVICLLSGSDNPGQITTASPGWVQAADAFGGVSAAQEAAIWYKPNCGASEAAPTFTFPNSSGLGLQAYGQLLEFSGALTASPLDTFGIRQATGGALQQTVSNTAVDAATGNLILTASRWAVSGLSPLALAAFSFTDTGSVATPIVVGSSIGGAVGSGGLSFGPATGVTATTLTLTGAGWTTNQWIGNGFWVVTMGTSRAIVTSNTATVLTFTGGWVGGTPALGTFILANTGRQTNFTYAINAGSPTGTVLQLTNFVGLEAVTTDGSLSRGFSGSQYSDDKNGAPFTGRKARGDPGTPTTAVIGDMVMSLGAQGYDGSNWIAAADKVGFIITGAVSAGVVPMRFAINGSAVGAGTLGYQEITADQTGITATVDITGLSVTATIAAGRRIRITCPHFVQSTVAADLIDVSIQEGATVLNFVRTRADAANTPKNGTVTVVLTPTAGSHTYKITSARNAGTGSVSYRAGGTFPSSILVEDIGI